MKEKNKSKTKFSLAVSEKGECERWGWAGVAALYDK